jgi:hypothetical protein
MDAQSDPDKPSAPAAWASRQEKKARISDLAWAGGIPTRGEPKAAQSSLDMQPKPTQGGFGAPWCTTVSKASTRYARPG